MKKTYIMIREIGKEDHAKFREACLSKGHPQQWVLRQFVLAYGAAGGNLKMVRTETENSY